MAQISIPYGEKEITFKIAGHHFQEILYPNRVTFPEDQITEVKQALEKPIGSGRLSEIVRPGQKIALLCDDISRPTPTAKLLPLIVEELNLCGVADEQITVIMALGSHRPMSEAEIELKVGAALRERLAVFNSEFRDQTKQVNLGVAPGGTQVWADRRAMEADIRIGIGSIVPHPAVGWSGGGKIIYPGITGEATVAAFHLQHGKTPWNMFGSENSPVRENMERWIKQVGLHFIVNVVCTPDGKIYKAVAGDYIKAHRVGVGFAKELYGVKANCKVDVAVVSSHPADADFWQATKGVLSGEFILKDGGTLILVTPCPEGVGPHPSYTTYIGCTGIENKLDEIAVSPEGIRDPLAAPVGATISRIKKRVKLALVSDGIDLFEANRAGFAKYATIEAAIDEILPQYGPSAKVTVLPYGAETYPIVAGT